jgi:N-acetylneuraminic acid mutarotase
VKVHLRNIFAKLEVASRTEAAMWAVQNGLVETKDAVDRMDVNGEQRAATEQEPPWLDRMPTPLRLFLFFGVAVIFVVIGFGVSQVFIPARSTPQPGEILVGSDFEETRWKQLPDMPTARAGLAAAVYNNQVYAIAGEGIDGILAVNERYDPTLNSWETLQPKPAAVADVQAAVVGGLIYVPGGRLTGGEMTNVLEIYDPQTDLWTQGASLPAPLSGYALATYEGKIYLFGGWDGKAYLDSVFIYDPAQDGWTAGTPMLSARAFTGAAVAGDKIHVFGGTNDEGILAANEIYVPTMEGGADSPWSQATAMPEGRYGIGVGSVTDVIYLFFGRNDAAENSRLPVIRFGTGTGQWESINAGSQSIFRSSAAVLGNTIYIVGGEADFPLATLWGYQAAFTVVIPILK